MVEINELLQFLKTTDLHIRQVKKHIEKENPEDKKSLLKSLAKRRRALLKLYVYVSKYVKEGDFKRKKLEKLFRSCKASIGELIDEGLFTFDNKQEERAFFGKMEDLEGKLSNNSMGEEERPSVKKWNASLKQIIPDINLQGLERDEEFGWYISPNVGDYEAWTRDEGNPPSTQYADTILFYIDDPEVFDFLLLFKDTIVLDLGAGSSALGYFIAQECKAKAYIGVDKFTAPNPEFLDKIYYEFGEDRIRGKPIPYACVWEDMLEFLKRFPSNSVSVLTCGVIEGFGGKYLTSVEEQITRVLHPKGAYINLYSSFEPKDLKKVTSNSIPYFGGLLKFTKKS